VAEQVAFHDPRLTIIAANVIPTLLEQSEVISIPGPSTHVLTEVRSFKGRQADGRSFALRKNTYLFTGLVRVANLGQREHSFVVLDLEPYDVDPIARHIHIAHSQDMHITRITPEGVEDFGPVLPYEQRMVVDALWGYFRAP
jgi:hypothetical protein